MGFWANIATAAEHFLAAYGLLAIFVVMLLKEAGLPVPVPSDLIMIAAGAQAATGVYPLFGLVIAIATALVVGGSLQFLIARGIGRPVVYRWGRYIGATPVRLDRASAMLQRRGAPAVAIGLNVPGIRAAMVPAAGLAGLRYRTFAPAMIAGTGLYYGWHIALGYIAGPTAIRLIARTPVPVTPIALGLAVIAVVIMLAHQRWPKDRAAPERLDSNGAWPLHATTASGPDNTER